MADKTSVSYQSQSMAFAWLDPAQAAGAAIEVFDFHGVNGHRPLHVYRTQSSSEGGLPFYPL